MQSEGRRENVRILLDKKGGKTGVPIESYVIQSVHSGLSGRDRKRAGRKLIVSTEYADDGVIGEKGRKLKSNDEGIGELNKEKEVTAKRGEVESDSI